MPRKKVEWVKLTGRVSAEMTNREDVEFVREKLKRMDQGDFIRFCVATQRQFETGKLISKDLLEQEIKATILKVLSGTEKVRNDKVNDPVPGFPPAVAKDDQKDEVLPSSVKAAVNDQVKRSSLLDQLQTKMKLGTLGPKTSGDKV